MGRLSSTLLGALVVLLAGCSGLRVSSDWDQAATAALQGYRSWAWLPGTPLRTGDPRIDNPLVDARLRTAVETVLGSKGLVRVDVEVADCLLGYHAAIESVEELRIDDYHGYQRGGWQASTVRYDEGTLILDIVDARSRQLVWRGTARGAVDADAAPAERSERVHDAVTAILEGFPPAQP